MAQRIPRRRTTTRRSVTCFVVGLALTFLLVVSGIGYFFFQQVRAWVANSDLLPSPNQPSSNPVIDWQPGEPIPTWEGKERVNILVMGIDARPGEKGPWRTDSMMILTVDPLTLSAGMLSIPRDLWVPIPGYGEGRINTANYLGDAYGYPGGGPALAARTVQYNLGVPIHHYVRVDFGAFVHLVDLIGGIDIYVPAEINDPLYPGPNYDYAPLYIPAGWVHMNGELALKYARTRYGGRGDFDRAARQQQVLMAVRDKVTRLDLLPQLLPQVPQVWETVRDSVVMDPNLTVDKIIRLAGLATRIPKENIRTGVIDETCTEMWMTPDGQQVLVPIRDRMREVRDYVFGMPKATPKVEDPATRITEEAAVIHVQNGTLTPGLAQKTAEYLRARGVQIGGYGNADRSDYAQSMILVYTGKRFTAEAIAGWLNLPLTAVVEAPATQVGVDILVILGADYRLPTP
jgi:LCP family protein required for cell wall assembly